MYGYVVGLWPLFCDSWLWWLCDPVAGGAAGVYFRVLLLAVLRVGGFTGVFMVSAIACLYVGWV